jgi:hypothetical protein
MSEAEADPVREALLLLNDNDPESAFRRLRFVFADRRIALEPDRLFEALGLLARIGARMVDERFSAPFEAAVAEPTSVSALYDAGYGAFEFGLFDVAACVLSRAHALAPGQEKVVSELVAALEEDGDNRAACLVLQAEAKLLKRSFICRYLLAFNAILAADLPLARETFEKLGAPADETSAFLAGRIRAMLKRVDAVLPLAGLTDQDLRGWHFVSTGGALLHLSPYGFGGGMQGRYAFTQDSYARCRHTLGLLSKLVEAWGLEPEQILAPDDRDSHILATAASRLLDLPLQTYGPDAGPGLIVAFDLSALSETTPRDLLFHRPGQVLFAHACCWTDPPACAPDAAGFLYQNHQLAWGERLQADPAGGVIKVPDLNEAVEVLVEKILSAEVDEELGDLDDPKRLALDWAAMRETAELKLGEQRRSNLWRGSPVKSNRFL